MTRLGRALLEFHCFDARSILERLTSGGAPIEQVILTSGLARNNALLMQLMAEILDREVQVPQIDHVAAVGAAIHGGVAAGVMAVYAEGEYRWGTKDRLRHQPKALYEWYRELSRNAVVRTSMHGLNEGAYLQAREETFLKNLRAQ